jgi:hypothetical protein
MGGGRGDAGKAGSAEPPAPVAPGGGARTAPPAQQKAAPRRNAPKESGTFAPQQAALPNAPAPEATELVAFDLNAKRIVQRLSHLPFATMTFSPDGKKLYLVGTPGNATAEDKANRLAYEQQAERQASQSVPRGGAAQSAVGGTPADANALIEELRRLRKTVTVIDAQSGRVLKTLTVGSLPQGAAMREKK